MKFKRMNDTEELKPCPFCGGEAEIKQVNLGLNDENAFIDSWLVECSQCKARTQWYGGEFTRDTDGSVRFLKNGRNEAVNDWNRRTK